MSLMFWRLASAGGFFDADKMNFDFVNTIFSVQFLNKKETSVSIRLFFQCRSKEILYFFN